jgi:glycosyltransferase involved in cell wall biosynthesis
MIRLSVVVPAYNEEATILEVLERIKAQTIEGVELESVVVDDGSSDGTGTLLEAHPQAYTHLVRLPTNQGKGAAVKAALQVASGDYVIFQDADLEYDPVDYARLLEPVLRFDADLVMGSRMSAPPYTRVHYFWHKQGNRFLTFLFNLLYNTTFTDIYSCYLLYRRSLLDPASLRSAGWEQHAEILCRVVSAGNAFYEVPISYSGRTYEEGKKIRARHAWPVIMMIIASRLRRGGAWVEHRNSESEHASGA